MKEAVICIVPTVIQADEIATMLCEEGFLPDDISVLLPDQGLVKDFGHKNATKAPEGAVTGAGTGAALGGTLGLLAGIGTIALPGMGAFIAAGPVMALLSGAAIGGGVGGIAGALIGLGFPEYEAKQYENKLGDGNILLSVHTESGAEAKRAEKIMKVAGAREIKRSVEERVRR
jgi:hypothetical protein